MSRFSPEMIAYFSQLSLIYWLLECIGAAYIVCLLVKRRAPRAPWLCWLIVVGWVVGIGTLEIDWYAWWNDHTVYAYSLVRPRGQEWVGDPVFQTYVETMRGLGATVFVYFGGMALVYVWSYYRACVNFAEGGSAVVMFLAVVTAPFFMAYGHNTMRAGMAMALAVLAMSCWPHKRVQAAVFAVLAVGLHLSVALTVGAFAAAMVLKKPSWCLCVWLACLGLSLAVGSSLETVLSGFVADDRVTAYVDRLKTKDIQYNTGFRVDFLLFSLLPMFFAWLYMGKRRWRDKRYRHLVCTYILANAVWVLMIRATYSDRFAYLSWALAPLILTYPLVKDPTLYGRRNYVQIAVVLGLLMVESMLI